MDMAQDHHLSDWDWRADLRAQERSILWLARQTSCHPNTVYRYSWGTRKAPQEWLRKASRALGSYGK